MLYALVLRFNSHDMKATTLVESLQCFQTLSMENHSYL